MSRPDKLEGCLWLACLAAIFLWVGYVKAHDDKPVVPEPVIKVEPVKDYEKEITTLENRLQELELDLKKRDELRSLRYGEQRAIATKQNNLVLEQRNLKRIINTPKPVAVVIPEPVRNPKVINEFLNGSFKALRLSIIIFIF